MNFDDEMRKALEADGKKLKQLTGEDHGPYWLDDGKTSSTVATEWATSLRVPIIPDADTYKGKMFTLGMPPAGFAPKGCTLPFTEENGKLIEAWMDKYVQPDRGDQLIIHLEDHGCVRLGVRRGGH